MATAKIGALHVSLGLDSAKFTAGLGKARADLGRFGSAATLGMAAITTAATAATLALVKVTSKAADNADALFKMSQQAGVSVENLSRLQYAARLSDVSLEGLTTGLGKLSRSMADASTGKGPAEAFRALGVSVTDSGGKLRDASDVFRDIAGRFARLEDGATKTALAIQIFGKGGAALIPVLNEGAEGLKRYADESDRVHFTVKEKTAKAVDEFRDSMDKLSMAMDGVGNAVLEGAIGPLNDLAATLSNPAFAEAIGTIGTGLVGAVNLLANAFLNAYNFGNSLVELLKKIPILGVNTGINVGGVQIGPGQKNGSAFTGGWGSKPVNQITVGGGKTYGEGWGGLPGLGGGGVGGRMGVGGSGVIPAFDTGAAVASLKPLDLGIDTTIEKVATLADSIGGPLTNAISGFVDAILSGENPLESFVSSLADIGKALLNQGIQGLVSSLLGGVNLGGMFGGGGSFVGAGFGSYGSFDGGGFTGYGPRSGGMDGKGGQLAMLHPNETVLDHTKGQGAGDMTTINVYADTFTRGADLANAVEPVVRRVLREKQRNPDR